MVRHLPWKKTQPVRRVTLKPKILIVDDQEEMRWYLREMLQEEGFATAEATNGKEALRLVRRESFDAVVTDLIMPDHEGIELIRVLRAEFPVLRIVAISGADAPVNLRAARLLGADATLSKPFHALALLEALEGRMEKTSAH